MTNQNPIRIIAKIPTGSSRSGIINLIHHHSNIKGAKMLKLTINAVSEVHHSANGTIKLFSSLSSHNTYDYTNKNNSHFLAVVPRGRSGSHSELDGAITTFVDANHLQTFYIDIYENEALLTVATAPVYVDITLEPMD